MLQIVSVVDDSAFFLSKLKSLVESEHVTVHIFTSAEKFLRAVDPSQSGCMLINSRLPGPSDLPLYEFLLQSPNHSPVIVRYASQDRALADKATSLGTFAVIDTSQTLEQIAFVIQKALIHDLQASISSDPLDLASRLRQLTARELETLKLIVTGMPNKKIAHLLDISMRTVEQRRARIMRKLNAHNLPELIKIAVKLGLE